MYMFNNEISIDNREILEQYKETSNNLINHTPFFIWSKDMKQTNINEVTSQLNILPTILNLFNLEYDSRLLIGKDILSDEEGIVIFNDITSSLTIAATTLNPPIYLAAPSLTPKIEQMRKNILVCCRTLALFWAERD